MRSRVHHPLSIQTSAPAAARNKIEQCYKRSDLEPCLRSEKGPEFNHCRVEPIALTT